MSNCILVITLISLICTNGNGDDSSVPNAKAKTFNEAVFEYASAKRQLGSEHPRLEQLKTDIVTRTLDGERLDFSELDARLTWLFSDYQSKKGKLSLRHPETQRTLEEFSLTTKLLRYDSEYFAKNWERLLAH